MLLLVTVLLGCITGDKGVETFVNFVIFCVIFEVFE